jgi:hypothetical protein
MSTTIIILKRNQPLRIMQNHVKFSPEEEIHQIPKNDPFRKNPHLRTDVKANKTHPLGCHDLTIRSLARAEGSCACKPQCKSVSHSHEKLIKINTVTIHCGNAEIYCCPCCKEKICQLCFEEHSCQVELKKVELMLEIVFMKYILKEKAKKKVEETEKELEAARSKRDTTGKKINAAKEIISKCHREKDLINLVKEGKILEITTKIFHLENDEVQHKKKELGEKLQVYIERTKEYNADIIKCQNACIGIPSEIITLMKKTIANKHK